MANDTPESEFSIECFQNYAASEVFIQGLAGIVDQNDVEILIRAQKTMLQRFEKTTEMLTNCNALSANRLKIAGVEFKKHTQLLVEMKKDLDYIYKKIRAIKAKLGTQYPEAYKKAVESSLSTQKQMGNEEDFEEDLQTAQPKEHHDKHEPEPKMVSTVSTETLKACSSQSSQPFENAAIFQLVKKRHSDAVQDVERMSIGSDHLPVNINTMNRRKKRESSSSETGSDDSCECSSSDTG